MDVVRSYILHLQMGQMPTGGIWAYILSKEKIQAKYYSKLSPFFVTILSVTPKKSAHPLGRMYPTAHNVT